MAARQDTEIAVLGAGHIAAALVQGLVRAGWDGAGITVAAPGADNRGRLAERFGVRAEADNRKAVATAPLVLLAVRPAQVGEALQPLADQMQGKLLLSLAASLSCRTLAEHLPGAQVARAMPNLGIAQGCGFTGLCSPQHPLSDGADLPQGAVSERELQALQQAQSLFAELGDAAWFAERLIPAVTALAGSAPGFLFHIAGALTEGGVGIGLQRQHSQQMTLSVLRTCAALLDADGDATAWEQKVATPGGTTDAGLTELRQGDLAALLSSALAAATHRATPPSDGGA